MLRSLQSQRRPLRIVILLLLSLPALSLAQSLRASTVVSTQQGPVAGHRDSRFSTLVWLGIPYAQPPIGPLRWKAPKDPNSHAQTIEANSYGSPCFQPGTKSSEDCLYLNIWRPASSETKLPVLVYVHGGNNIYGSGEGTWQATAHYLHAIVVTFNYRLGPMGWFLHPAMLRGDPRDDSGNYGTLDQIQLLTWVQRNMAKFGGDITNVTLAGDSAGAQNVTYLMHSALAKDLFQKVLISSNYPIIRPLASAYKSSKQVLYNLMVADGLAADTASAKSITEARMSSQEIRNYLYSKSPEQLIKVFANPDMGPIDSSDMYRDDIVTGQNHTPPPLIQSPENRPESMQIIGDGYVIPKGLDFADFSDGHLYPRPMIIGTTHNENHAFYSNWPFNFQQHRSLDTLVTEAVHGTGKASGRMQQFFAQFSLHDSQTFRLNYTFATDLIDELHTYYGAQMPARNMVHSHAAHGMPVYVYSFNWASDAKKNYAIPDQDAWIFYVGSPHTSEFDFFYQNFFGLSPADAPKQYQYTTANLPGRRQLSLALRSYLKSFLWNRDGRITNSSNQPIEWQPWTATSEQSLALDADTTTADITMRTSISRTPEQLYAAHAAFPNAAARDFMEYAVLWGWCINWYPNSAVGHFSAAPGPNPLFDPAKP